MMVAVETIQDTQTTSALQQAMKALEPCDGGELHCVQRGAEKRLMEKQRRLNRFLGKLNDWEQAHKHVACHDENKSRTRASSSEGNSRRSQVKTISASPSHKLVHHAAFLVGDMPMRSVRYVTNHLTFSRLSCCSMAQVQILPSNN